MLETLYSTRLRRLELIGLQWTDVDYDRGTLFIRQGKGKKDRLIPIDKRALLWISQYTDQSRPVLALGQYTGHLFVTHLGEAFKPNSLSKLVADYISAADLNKTGSCHLFRHSCATAMLENGADIRFIQALLGHADASTTVIRQLKEVHTLPHPAKVERGL